MAFITVDDTVVSFAIFDDAQARDIKMFQSNEDLNDEDLITDLLIRATQRILVKIRASSWWIDYYTTRAGGSNNTVADIPAVNPDLILDRQVDFTDLCVYGAFYEFALPLIANIGVENDPESTKLDYYEDKFNRLLNELILAGDWYDFNADGIIQSEEKEPSIKLMDEQLMIRIH